MTLTAAESFQIEGLHAIPLGDTASDIIRVILMMVEAALLGKIVFGLLDKRSFMHYLPWERRIAWLCVATFVARNLYVQIIVFGQPLTWEGTPFTFLALGFGWYAVRKVRVPVTMPEPKPIFELKAVEVPHNRRRTDPDYNGNRAARATTVRPAAR